MENHSSARAKAFICHPAFLSLLFLLNVVHAQAQEQPYDVYYRNIPVPFRIVIIKKEVYAPLEPLCKTLELELTKEQGAFWIGDEPKTPQKETLYVNGKIFADTLIRHEAPYVRLKSFLPEVGFRVSINEETRIVDLIKKRNPLDDMLITKYLTDDVMKHFEKEPGIHAYLVSVKNWTTRLVEADQESSYNFEGWLDALKSKHGTAESYQDLFATVDKLAAALKLVNEQMDKLTHDFPDGAVPPEFAKSHKMLKDLKELCRLLDTSGLQGYHASKGIRPVTTRTGSCGASVISFRPVETPLGLLIVGEVSMEDAYKKYLKMFHSELSTILLKDHFAVKHKSAFSPNILAQLEAARKLTFKTPVKGVEITPEQEENQFQKAVSEIKPAEIEQDKGILKELGFVPPDWDPAKVDIKTRAEEIPAYYDPKTKFFYYRNDVPEDLLDLIAYHELTHAVTDQYYDLTKLDKAADAAENSDRSLALRALIEGDAEYTMFIPEVDKYDLDEDFLRTTFMNYQLGDSFSNRQDDDPEFLRNERFFPYKRGEEFIRQLKRWGGWALPDSCYLDPPVSTHQILHPEDYALVREQPSDFSFPVLPSAKLIATDTLGEFNIRMLYAIYHSDERKDFSAWQGDRFEVFRKGGHDSIVWLSAWRSDKDAENFAKLYRETVNRIGDPGEETHKKVDAFAALEQQEAEMNGAFENVSENKGVGGTFAGRDKPRYTTLVLQKGNVVEALQDIPSAEVDAWKAYADQVKWVAPSPPNPSARILWPFQKLPSRFSAKLTPAQQAIAAVFKKELPQHWKFEATDLPYFPLAMESPRGDRILIGAGKFSYGFSDAVSEAGEAAFAAHAFPSLRVSKDSEEFGDAQQSFLGLSGDSVSSAGKPAVHLAIWTPTYPSAKAYILIAVVGQNNWIQTEPQLNRLLDDFANWIEMR